MLRRTTRVLIEVVLGLVAAAALLIGVTIWRLSQEPLRVDFLTPYLERALGVGDQGSSVEIGETVLIWADWSRTLDLRARQVKLRDADGLTVATFPTVSVNLSLRALVQGVVAPTQIEVIGARVTAVRRSDGSLDFGLGLAEAEARDSADESDLSVVLPSLVGELVSEPSLERPLSFLNVARILDGSLTIFDRRLNTVWRAPSATMEVRRDPFGLAGAARMAVDMGQESADVEVTFLHNKSSRSSNIAASFSKLRVNALASLLPGLAPLEGLDVALDGSLTADLDDQDRFRSIAFDLTGGPGTLSLPEWLPETLPMAGLEIRGQVDGVAQELEIAVAKLRFGAGQDSAEGDGPTASLAGRASMSEGDLHIELETTAGGITAEALHRYWPPPIGTNAREWVIENVTAGRVDEARLKVSAKVPDGDFAAAEVEAMSGGYRYRDLEVHYYRPMPPVVGVSGTAVFDEERMTFAPEGGVVGDLSIAESEVEIVDLDKEDQAIAIDILVVGAIRSMLELLDHEKLRLVSTLGIDPAQAGGQGNVLAGFTMPLIRDLTYEQMKITAEAELTNVSMRDAVLQRSATNGNLTLSLDKTGMAVSGPVELAGVPVELDWQERFEAGEGPRSQFVIRVETLKQADREVLGLDMLPYLDGPVAASLLVALYSDNSGTLDAVMSLDRAKLSIPFLNWEKPHSIPGELRVVLQLKDEQISDLEEIEVSAGSLSARGKGRILEDGVTRLELETFAWDKSRLKDVTLLLGREEVDVTVGGGVFDAAPFMGKSGGDPKPAGGDEEGLPVFTFSAPRLEAITFAEDRQVDDVAIALDRRADGWRLMSIDAKIPWPLWSDNVQAEDPEAEADPPRQGQAGVDDETAEPPTSPAKSEAAVEAQPFQERTFKLVYQAAEHGGYTLEVATEDMGAFLRALNLHDTIQGGRLRITGSSDGPIPNHPLMAHIEAEDFVMVEAPILANMLTVASLTGLMDTLSGNGIQFDRLISDFTLTNGVVHTDLLRVYGSALGITAKGSIDFNTTQVDLGGTIVPAYTINRILGAIPLLGPILTGGEGEGLIGFVYEMEGDLENPDVSVNPLSALAPGFLRGLFQISDSEDEPTVYPEGRER